MSQYRTGTASVTNGSATVTGAGTAWLANIAAGNYFFVPGDVVAYEVASVDSDTEITLTAPYGGVTASGVAYVLHVDFHPNGSPKLDKNDVDSWAILNTWLVKSYVAGTLGTMSLVDAQTAADDATAGHGLLVGAFGLGEADNIPLNNDLDTITATGFYRYGGGASNSPAPVEGVVTHITRFFDTSAMRHSQHAIDAEGNSWTRINDNGTWSDWAELYHTGNLNQFEFGATGSGDVIAGNCAATSTTVCRCYFPVSMFAPASSITVAGTFSIYDKTFALVRAGIPSTDLILSNATAFKTAVIEVNNNVGLVDGDQYFLVSESAASKITVNP